MKKNVMLPIRAITIVFCLFAVFSGIYAQGSAGDAPKPQSPTTEETLEVVFGTFKNYKHSSGWFSMNVPENWTISEKSVEGEYIISVTDPTENAAYVVRVWSSQEQMSDVELEDLLKLFLNDSLSSFLNFKLGNAAQKNGRVAINFTYDSEINEKSYPMVGDSFIAQNGSIVGVWNLLMPKEQYNKKKNVVNKMLDSIKITP